MERQLSRRKLDRQDKQSRREMRFDSPSEVIAGINNQLPAKDPFYQPVDIGPAGYRALAAIGTEMRRRYPGSIRQFRNEMQRIREDIFAGRVDPVAYQQTLMEGGDN